MIVLWLFLGALLLFLIQRGVYGRFWARRLSVRVEFDRSSATAGEDAVLREQVINRKLLPLPMLCYRCTFSRNFELYRENGEKPLQISRRLAIPGRRVVRSQTVLRKLRRGVYTLTDGELVGQDLFYTLSSKQSFQSGARLTVWPEKCDLNGLGVPYRRLLGAVLTRRATQEDPFEIRNIRPYEIYDSMRMINWKASARTGELKVNQHDHTTDEALCIVVDAEHGTLDEREQLLSVASTLAQMFLRRGISVCLRANGRSCIGGREIRVDAGSGAAHLRVIDDNLAQLKLGAAPTRGFSELLTALTEENVNALCVAISAGGDREIGAAFDALCGADGGYFLRLGDAPLPGRRFTVLPIARRKEAAS